MKTFLWRMFASIALVAATIMTGLGIAATAKISDDIVKIGVLTDMSGSYADITGKGSVEAVKMAVEDFGGKVLGKPIEVIFADHQNKADIASLVSREWFDTKKVDMITDVVTSSVALAVVKIAAEKKKIAIVNGAATSRLTNEDCTPYSVHYAYDTFAVASGTGTTMAKEGGDSWFFITADYAFGQSLEKDVTDVVKAANGRVLGSVKHPLNAADFSSYMLQAQASGAKIIGLANAGGDAVNAVKAAHEFGLVKSGKQKIASLQIDINDVHALGLPIAQGLYSTTGFYWDMNDETRRWSERFFKRIGRMPSMIQAANYSATLHYLLAIAAAGTDDADTVMKKMRELPVNDFFAKDGKIRADGRMVHDMYLVQVKTPAESKRPWDYLNIKVVIPGDQAFRSLAQSVCSLVKNSGKG